MKILRYESNIPFSLYLFVVFDEILKPNFFLKIISLASILSLLLLLAYYRNKNGLTVGKSYYYYYILGRKHETCQACQCIELSNEKLKNGRS